jgi:hypothetical protein
LVETTAPAVTAAPEDQPDVPAANVPPAAAASTTPAAPAPNLPAAPSAAATNSGTITITISLPSSLAPSGSATASGSAGTNGPTGPTVGPPNTNGPQGGNGILTVYVTSIVTVSPTAPDEPVNGGESTIFPSSSSSSVSGNGTAGATGSAGNGTAINGGGGSASASLTGDGSSAAASTTSTLGNGTAVQQNMKLIHVVEAGHENASSNGLGVRAWAG